MRALRSCGWNSRSLLPVPDSIKDIEMADSTHYVIRAGLEGRNDFATDPNTVAGTPRVVQTRGRRPTP